MSSEGKILVYLKPFLTDSSIAAVQEFDNKVFRQATFSLKVIEASLSDQVAMYCQRLPPSARKVVTAESLLDRQHAISRSLILINLFRNLLGRYPDSPEIAKIFAGDNPKPKKIMESKDPDVVKLRKYLGPAMVLFDLWHQRESFDVDCVLSILRKEEFGAALLSSPRFSLEVLFDFKQS